VSASCSVYNFELKILQHYYPTASPTISIWNNGQPLQRFVQKWGLVKILFKIHDTPNESIALSLHGMKTTLDWRQAFAGISNDLLLPPRFLWQNSSNTPYRLVNIQDEQFVEILFDQNKCVHKSSFQYNKSCVAYGHPKKLTIFLCQCKQWFCNLCIPSNESHVVPCQS
jgi:hypothetical protein